MPQIRGIDVSQWQGNIDWSRVKADGIEFAMIRVGYGTNLDQQFQNNMQNANAAGIYCGAYLYSYALTAADAIAEADFVLQNIAPYRLTYPVAYDLEDRPSQSLSPSQKGDVVAAFCSRIREKGYYPLVYNNLWWFENSIALPKIEAYDKWIAQWDVSTPTFAGETSMWQYTNKGSVSGISGNVDKNISFKDYNQIIIEGDFNNIPKPEPPSNNYTPGTAVRLQNTPLYATATSSTVSNQISGTYYIYDGQKIHGRMRITNSASKVGKRPIGENVTGFVNISDL